jgi:hypothetical protein
LTALRSAWNNPPAMAETSEPLRIMLGFVVRQCARHLGHPPRPEELAEWANNQRDANGVYRIFGRAINAEEARVILRHPDRLVTIRPGPRWDFMTTLSR